MPTLTTKAIQLLKENNELRLRVAMIMGRSQASINRYIKENRRIADHKQAIDLILDATQLTTKDIIKIETL